MPAEQLKLQSKRRSAILNRSTIGSSKKVNSNNQSPVFQSSNLPPIRSSKKVKSNNECGECIHSFLKKSEIE